MTTARRQRAFGARTGWWALAVRGLALLLALAVALPEAGLAADIDYHRHAGLASVSDPAGAAPSADPGIAVHAHCGCHVATPASEPDPALPAARPRPRYGRVTQTLSSFVPDLLPRPPRA